MGKDRARYDPTPLKDVIGEVGARFGVARPATVGALWARWTEIVGDDIAANAEPTSVREGVLRIRTPSSAWATEIGYLADDIRARVNEALGSDLVREVRVWTGPGNVGHRPIPQESGEASPATDATTERSKQERSERSPEEALAAARAAWQRRRIGPRDHDRARPAGGSEKPPPTREKGR